MVSARLLCSMSGLETLDGNLFITIASGDYFEALIEGLAELVHIVQLDCELHQFNLGLLHRLGLHTADDPDLDWNGLAELTTFGAAESEKHLEDVVTNDSILSNLDRHAEIKSLHSLHVDHVNRHVDNFDGHTDNID